MQTKNKNYFSMGAGQSQSEQCSCSKPDQWIWSFGQISEDGLFQFYTRSCKGIVHYILFDQGQRTWSGAVPFRKRLCNVAAHIVNHKH